MNGLLGSAVLEVAVGLVFVYLLLAIFCTTVNEWIAGVFRTRGKTLQQGILQLLAPGQAAAKAAQDPIVAQFYEHPLIKSLFRDGYHPAYLAPRTFAKAIMDIATPNTPGSITFDDLENGIQKDLPAGTLQTSLLAVLQGTDRKIQDAQKSIELWYDDHMDRVSGWYKRKTQLWTVILAVAITAATNADTLHIARRLWMEPTLRSQLVELAKSAPNPSQSATANPPANPPANPAVGNQTAEALGMIFGWQDAGIRADWGSWAARMAGWILTIAAVSLGAPFWFDVLNRVMNLRSSGRSPAEAA